MADQKRIVSVLIPYRLEDQEIWVYLQKRSADMESIPNYFGLWGGGLDEGESPEQALIREIKEELNVDLNIAEVILLNRYEFLRAIGYVYLLPVLRGWEKGVKIGEGDYGKWFKIEDAFTLNDLTFQDKVILNDIQRMLLKKPIR